MEFCTGNRTQDASVCTSLGYALHHLFYFLCDILSSHPVILNDCPLLHRFIACLCFPILEVLLHTIIGELRSRDDKVYYMKATDREGKKWWKKTYLWTKFARIGLPMTYIVITVAILFPGILNLMMEA